MNFSRLTFCDWKRSKTRIDDTLVIASGQKSRPARTSATSHSGRLSGRPSSLPSSLQTSVTAEPVSLNVMHSISPPTNFCMASRVLSSSISFGSSIGRSARTLIFSSFIVKPPYATFSLVALSPITSYNALALTLPLFTVRDLLAIRCFLLGEQFGIFYVQIFYLGQLF